MLTKAAEDVLAERTAQVVREGWTSAHDDDHRDGVMARAAGVYALHAGASDAQRALAAKTAPPQGWPWDRRWWKPKTRRQDLVRAGALILAEIERLDRIEEDALEGHPPTRRMYEQAGRQRRDKDGNWQTVEPGAIDYNDRSHEWG